MAPFFEDFWSVEFALNGVGIYKKIWRTALFLKHFFYDSHCILIPEFLNLTVIKFTLL